MSENRVDELLKFARQAARQRQHEAALKALGEALILDEARIEVHDALGALCLMLRRNEQAAHHFERITQLLPEKASGFVNLGAALNRLERHDEAVKALLKGVQRDAHCAIGFYNLGIAYRKMGQKAMAVSAYKEAIRLEPEMVEAYQNLGNAYLDSGNAQMAAEYFEKALKLKPDFERAKRGLKQAEHVKQASGRFISPFGRLVDEDKYKKSGTYAQPNVVMSTPEDRQRLLDETRTCAMAIRVTGRELVEHLRDELLATMLQMQSVVAQGRESSIGFAKLDRRYRETVEQSNARRRVLVERMQALRESEAGAGR